MRKGEVGHHFLARLGKTRLRPGGKRATDWLIQQGHFSKSKKVLEVACNICTTSIGLAKKHGCQITGIDLDKDVLEKARRNIAKHHLSHLIEVMHGNATRLPFEDNSFDIVLNEAMLTMLPMEAKEKAVSEYLRVLKPGGILLTHDVVIGTREREATVQDLQKAIHIKATPLTELEWHDLFQRNGFQKTKAICGKMSLLSPQGLIHDEGILGALKIAFNALKPENREIFKKMAKTFHHPKKRMGFIAMCSMK